jgi:hypothetical protein
LKIPFPKTTSLESDDAVLSAQRKVEFPTAPSMKVLGVISNVADKELTLLCFCDGFSDSYKITNGLPIKELYGCNCLTFLGRIST